MSMHRKDDYRRYCLCIDDIVKVIDCYNCPHFDNNQIKLENTCSYSELQEE